MVLGDPLDSLQLRYLLLSLICKNVFTGVYASDQLKHCKSESFAIISNSENSSSPGLHWICMWKEKSSKCLEFWDSCGMDISFYKGDIYDFLKSFNLPIKRLVDRIQPLSSFSCGYFCVYFLLNRSKGKTFDDIASSFNSQNLSKNNELVLTKFRNITIPTISYCKSICESNCMKSDDFSSVCIQKNNQCFQIKRKIDYKI